MCVCACVHGSKCFECLCVSVSCFRSFSGIMSLSHSQCEAKLIDHVCCGSYRGTKGNIMLLLYTLEHFLTIIGNSKIALSFVLYSLL